jgi:hypothetical protein
MSPRYSTTRLVTSGVKISCAVGRTSEGQPAIRQELRRCIHRVRDAAKGIVRRTDFPVNAKWNAPVRASIRTSVQLRPCSWEIALCRPEIWVITNTPQHNRGTPSGGGSRLLRVVIRTRKTCETRGRLLLGNALRSARIACSESIATLSVPVALCIVNPTLRVSLAVSESRR